MSSFWSPDEPAGNWKTKPLAGTEGNIDSPPVKNSGSENTNSSDVFAPAVPAPSMVEQSPPLPPPLLPMTPSLKMRPLPPPRARMEPTESAVTVLSGLENQYDDPEHSSIANGHNSSNNVHEIDNGAGNGVNEGGGDRSAFDGGEGNGGGSGDDGNIQEIELNNEMHEVIRNPSHDDSNDNDGRDNERPQRHRDHHREVRREERRRRRKERAAAEHQKELENDARRFFILGFFALPLLWLVLMLYFHNEHKDANASPKIKRCMLSLHPTSSSPQYLLSPALFVCFFLTRKQFFTF